MNVFTGAQVHDGVSAPLGGPTHFFDFFFDAAGDGAVADVGVDFDEEIAADDHRLELGMVDIGGNYRSSSRYFGTHEFGRDLAWYRRSERLAWMLVAEGVLLRSRK